MAYQKKGRFLKCKVCSKEIYAKPSHSLSVKYCSYQCKAEGQKKGSPMKCKECGKSYYRPPSQVQWRGSSYCSYPCASRGGSKEKKGKIKSKFWNWRHADRVFSDFIRSRDGWTCRNCKKNLSQNTGQLHNSHYWSRVRYTTRFDPDNCIALCFYCHKYKFETEKHGDYRKLMIEWLGTRKYNALAKRAQKMTTRANAIAELMKWIEPHLKVVSVPKKSPWPPRDGSPSI